MIADSDRFSSPRHVLLREVEEETILLNTESEAYFALNEVGAVVLKHVINGMTVKETLDELMNEFRTDRATLEADVHDLLGELVRTGLLVRQID